ncbi:MAG: TolC family protein [Gemmataceae bacterium]|nr:TolC family protein [Gemmataceae bacterium]
MMRWSARILGFVALCGLAGCTRQCFLAEKDFQDAHLLPRNLEAGDQSILHGPLLGKVHAPPDVNDPNRPPRYLSLQEAIAISLENGTASGRGGPGFGIVDDNLLQFQLGAGTLNGQTDRIRVLALQPAVAAANLEANIARFDAIWVNSMNWSATDNLQQGLTSFQNGSRAQFSSTLAKLLPTGGVANLSFQTDYTLLQNPPAGIFGVLNPNYTTRFTLGFEQPLLRNYGVEINQLLSRAPGITGATMPQAAAAAFNNQQVGLGNLGVINEGILIARLRFDQQRAEFERNLTNLVLNVEVAYWKLYQAYGRLYAFEEVMRLAHKSWMNAQNKFEVGALKPEEFHPVRAQYEEFRGERMASVGAVLEAERNLRGIMGLPVEDGVRLVPITPPTLAPYRPEWSASLTDALNLRPELVLARENVRAHQLRLITQKNFLKPDLRFVAQYSPVGFGTELDGDGNFIDGNGVLRPANALESLSNMHFNDWSLGLTLSVPLGYRAEHAAVRSARLELAQSYYVLKDQEDKVQRILAQQYQKLSEWYGLIQARRAERDYYGKAVQVRYTLVGAGTGVADINLLDAQRRLALAQVKEYEAISEYNNSLARFEWAKGTILQHNNVTIAEGALPPCAQVRAVEHERERTKAFVLRNRPEPLTMPGCLACDNELPDELPAQVPNHVAAPILKETDKNATLRPKEGAAPAKKLPLGFSDAPAPAPQPGEVKFAPIAPPLLPATSTQKHSSGSGSPPPVSLPPTKLSGPRPPESSVPPPLPPPITPTGSSLAPPLPLPPAAKSSPRPGSSQTIYPQTTQPGSTITIHQGPPPELPSPSGRGVGGEGLPPLPPSP